MYDELVKRLREAPNDWPDADLHYEAADAIEERQKAVNFHKFNSEFWEDKYNSLADEKWIPVTERLPEVDQPVMICAFGKSVGEGVYRGHDGFHHVWKMYTSSGTYWDDEVTHWMSLPQPPKEG